MSGIDPQTGARTFGNQAYFGRPRGAIFSISQPLFDGFKTKNSVAQAEFGVFAARAALRFVEQDVLLKGVTAYMDVLRDAAVLRLRKKNIGVLKEQLRETRVRYDEVDVTFTDPAQAEASLAQAYSHFYLAEANLKVSSAQLPGRDRLPPDKLEPAPAIDRLLPETAEEALTVAARRTSACRCGLASGGRRGAGGQGRAGGAQPSVSLSGAGQPADTIIFSANPARAP